MRFPVLLVTALGWEASAVRASLAPGNVWKHGRFRLWRDGRREGLWLLRGGMGAAPALEALEWASTVARPASVVSTGCAGALRDGLSAGDWVIADRVLDGSGAASAASEWSACYERAASAAGARVLRGDVLSSRGVIASAEHKRIAAAESGCLAVDMESAAIAAWAARRGVDFAAARAIVDTASTTLPETAIDDEGRLRPARLAAAMLRDPRLWGVLVTLGRAMRRCEASLRAVHRELVSEIPPA